MKRTMTSIIQATTRIQKPAGLPEARNMSAVAACTSSRGNPQEKQKAAPGSLTLWQRGQLEEYVGFSPSAVPGGVGVSDSTDNLAPQERQNVLPKGAEVLQVWQTS